MGEPIRLNEEEKVIYDDLCAQWKKVLENAQNRTLSMDDYQLNYNKMRDMAFDLHNKLTARGIEIKHHAYMIENRGVEPNNIEFYDHTHSVEDLLKFIKDRNANDDPEDITLDLEFEFPYYTLRWGHKEVCSIIRNSDGWIIQYISNKIQSEKDGKEGLMKVFKQDYVNYPSGLFYFFEELWQKAADEGLTSEQVQQGLNDLGEWVTVTERSRPIGSLWRNI